MEFNNFIVLFIYFIALLSVWVLYVVDVKEDIENII